MRKEQIIELNEIRKYLGVSIDDFIKILAMAKMRQKQSTIIISDEMLCEIIKEALLNIDYEISDEKKDLSFDLILNKRKSLEESLIRAIKNLDF